MRLTRLLVPVLVAAAAAAVSMPASANAGEPIVILDDNMNLTWTATGTTNDDGGALLEGVYCDPCDSHPWPGGPTYLWHAPACTNNLHPGEDCYFEPGSDPPCYKFQPDGFRMHCRTLASFTATGGAGNDVFDINSIEGGPSIPVSVATGAGNDRVEIGGYGSRFADGGEGPTATDQDIVSIHTPTGGPNLTWTVNMQSGVATSTGGSAPPITFTNFENASTFLAGLGSPGHTLIGNAEANKLSGASGNDTLRGFGENDQLGGSSGNDTLEGGDGDDILYASFGNDTLTGGAGVDEFWCSENPFNPETNVVTDNVPGEELHFCQTFQGSLLPDATVRRSNGDPVGDDEYEAQPSSNQTVSWSAKKGQTRQFVVALSYDGTGTAPITVDGCAGNDKFTVKYLDDSGDVSAAVAGGTYLTGALDPQEEATLNLKIKPKKDKGTLKCDTSATSGGETDAVRAELKAK